MGDATAVLLCVLVVAVLVAAVGFAVANATHMRHLTCTITDKDRAWVSSGESGHSSQRVYTDQCGVLSVGAPIRDRTGKVLAALSVAFPKYLDASQTLQGVTPLVVEAAHRISRAVGGVTS